MEDARLIDRWEDEEYGTVTLYFEIPNLFPEEHQSDILELSIEFPKDRPDPGSASCEALINGMWEDVSIPDDMVEKLLQGQG